MKIFCVAHRYHQHLPASNFTDVWLKRFLLKSFVTHKKSAADGHKNLFIYLSVNVSWKPFEFTNYTKNGLLWCSIKSKALILLNYRPFWRWYTYTNSLLTVTKMVYAVSLKPLNYILL